MVGDRQLLAGVGDAWIIMIFVDLLDILFLQSGDITVGIYSYCFVVNLRAAK